MFLTVTLHVNFLPVVRTAVIVHFPFPLAVILPPETVATFLLDVVHLETFPLSTLIVLVNPFVIVTDLAESAGSGTSLNTANP